MLEMIAVYVENSNLKTENARLKAKLAELKARDRAFTCDTEVKIQSIIHKIKCRDEVPNNIFLGKKEVDAIKALGSIDRTNADPDGPFGMEQSYMGYRIVKVNKATFVDVSTVP
jgi:hypothetical protein